MPFTFCHPAIILPFIKNKNASATALIVGAMSPDFEYFFRMKMQSEISHTLLGVFLVDFPLGFIVIFAFHGLIKKPLIQNSPIFIQQRLQGLKEFDWFRYFKTNVLIVLISFFVGTVSHIFWDSFTHWDGYFVQQFSVLNLKIYSIAVYKLAQHLSSIIGLGIIASYFFKLPVNEININTLAMRYWYLIACLSAVIIAIRFYYGTHMDQIGNAVVSVISPIIIAFCLGGFIFRNRDVI